MPIRFVGDETNSHEELSKNLRLAYGALQERNESPEWLSEKDCLQLQDRNADVFVCDPFDGPAFEHLKRLKVIILGPQCVLCCLERRKGPPKLPYPVYTATMMGIVVCCTSIEKKTRLELHEKIQLMGGQVSGNLTSSVTHLVAGEVGSKKYHVACNLGKPVMLPEWVFECWRTGLTKNTLATDSVFDELNCPIFRGLHITVSQVDSDERREIQNIVSNNGGKYSGELRANDTTHLIAIQPEGQKYHFARQWKIHCVTVSWLFDSLKKGFCMDESLYKLNNNTIAKTSTPVTSSRNDMQSLPDTSSISNGSVHSRINETMRPDNSYVNKSTVEGSTLSSVHSLEKLSLSAVSKAGNFLDGCKIFFSGFIDTHLEKLRKVVNMGGGTRFSQLCDSVSHVVINTGTSEHIQLLENLQVRPHVVSVDWLIESYKIGKQAEETPFLKLDPNMLQSVTLNVCAQLSPQLSNITTPLSTSANNGSVYDDEVMCQYLQKSSLVLDYKVLPKTTQECEEETVSEVGDPAELAIARQIDCFEEADHATTDEPDTAGIFIGMTFVILGFDNEDATLLEDMITENKGNIESVDNIAQVSIDYSVVPLLGYDGTIVVSEVVTNYWVQMCIEKVACLPLEENELFRPLSFNINVKPLLGCVLSISQYSGTERDALVCLIEILGANYQEFFVRKANSNSNLIPSTHLVCMVADGSKYKGALKWGLPAVTKQWLLACAKAGNRVTECKYLVGDTRTPNLHADVTLLENDVEKSLVEPMGCRAYVSEGTNISSENVPGGTNDIKKQTVNLQAVADKDVRSCTPVAKRIFTPARSYRPQMSRIKELIQEDRIACPPSPECTGVDTPGKFLNPDVPFKPSFDFTDVVQILNSPSNNNSSHRRSSISVEDWLGVNLQQAVTQSQQKNFNPGLPKAPVDKQCGPLATVIMCVSKKLSAEQGELNDIVTALGGDYRWTFDTCCTHFVYQGKNGETSRELKMAREHGKKIVAPDWLYACKESGNHENEELYPFTYNANMTLEVRPTKINLRSKTKQDVSCPIKSKLRTCTNDATDSDHSLAECSGSLNCSSSSKDNQTSVNRQMELMLATKTDKGNKKRKQASSPFVPPNENNRSNVQVRNDSPRIAKVGAPEVSSSVPITWDDPTSRLEREKLAEQLAKESQSLSPETYVGNENTKNEQAARTSNDSNKENDGRSESPARRTPPPFSNSKSNILKQAPRFMLSGMNNQERIDYAALVAELGGSVSEGQHFDNNCTHLVVNQPSRNEKFLASLASGKWILHKSYLEDCRQENRFVDELPYEWGGEMLLKKIPLTNSQLLKIAQSAHRWRLKLNPSPNNLCSDVLKAFHGWNVIVYTDHQRENSFRRLLEAGGATLVSSAFPFSNPKNASFAFLELSKAPSREVDLGTLLDKGVHCLKPEYIAAFLTEEPAPSVQNFYIPEVKDLMNDGENDSTFGGKRKSGSNVVPRSKKTRR